MPRGSSPAKPLQETHRTGLHNCVCSSTTGTAGSAVVPRSGVGATSIPRCPCSPGRRPTSRRWVSPKISVATPCSGSTQPVQSAPAGPRSARPCGPATDDGGSSVRSVTPPASGSEPRSPIDGWRGIGTASDQPVTSPCATRLRSTRRHTDSVARSGCSIDAIS